MKIMYTTPMENDQKSGFHELEHTADWELEVWAPEINQLLIEAARGMYHLTGLKLTGDHLIEKKIIITKHDNEQLLVAFLNELVFYLDDENLGFDQFDLILTEKTLSARLRGSPVQSLRKEIKAVTYHNLTISQNHLGFRVKIVFDV
jgi:SHS2 domain-containing protein